MRQVRLGLSRKNLLSAANSVSTNSARRWNSLLRADSDADIRSGMLRTPSGGTASGRFAIPQSRPAAPSQGSGSSAPALFGQPRIDLGLPPELDAAGDLDRFGKALVAAPDVQRGPADAAAVFEQRLGAEAAVFGNLERESPPMKWCCHSIASMFVAHRGDSIIA